MAARNPLSSLYAHTHSLGRLREPFVFIGAGILAGLFIFMVWFARQPSLSDAGPVLPAAAAQGAGKAVAAHEGVLGDITGEPDAEQSAAQVQESPAPVIAEDPPIAEDADAPPAGTGDDAAMSDSDVINPAADDVDTPPPADLQTYFIEVERGPGVSEILQVNAKSPEHALTIVRDYRGNPRVLRGPSLQPLD